MRPSPRAVRDLAEADHQEVISLIQELVRVPTRGGVDNCEPLISLVEAWLNDRGLGTRRLPDLAGADALGIVCDVAGGQPGPHYVLDACLDTAPFGNERDWLYGPTSAVIDDGWLYGRGAADSKAAIAILCTLRRMFSGTQRRCAARSRCSSTRTSTGRFGGAKRYFGDIAPTGISGVMIGYPGIDKLVVGGRGFLRAALTVRGKAGHTGSQRSVGDGNAVEGAAELVRALSAYHVLYRGRLTQCSSCRPS